MHCRNISRSVACAPRSCNSVRNRIGIDNICKLGGVAAGRVLHITALPLTVTNKRLFYLYLQKVRSVSLCRGFIARWYIEKSTNRGLVSRSTSVTSAGHRHAARNFKRRIDSGPTGRHQGNRGTASKTTTTTEQTLCTQLQSLCTPPL